MNKMMEEAAPRGAEAGADAQGASVGAQEGGAAVQPSTSKPAGTAPGRAPRTRARVVGRFLPLRPRGLSAPGVLPPPHTHTHPSAGPD